MASCLYQIISITWRMQPGKISQVENYFLEKHLSSWDDKIKVKTTIPLSRCPWQIITRVKVVCFRGHPASSETAPNNCPEMVFFLPATAPWANSGLWSGPEHSWRGSSVYLWIFCWENGRFMHLGKIWEKSCSSLKKLLVLKQYNETSNFLITALKPLI